MKKFIALLGAVVLSVSLFVGCGTNKENKEEKDKNNIIKSKAKKSKFNLRKIDWAIIGRRS